MTSIDWIILAPLVVIGIVAFILLAFPDGDGWT